MATGKASRRLGNKGRMRKVLGEGHKTALQGNAENRKAEMVFSIADLRSH